MFKRHNFIVNAVELHLIEEPSYPEFLSVHPPLSLSV